MTDVFLRLDRKLNKKLFVPDAANDRLALAAKEGCKCKKLLSALRALWRSSHDSHDDRLSTLKSYLQCSPTRRAASPAPSSRVDESEAPIGDQEAPIGDQEPSDVGEGNGSEEEGELVRANDESGSESSPSEKESEAAESPTLRLGDGVSSSQDTNNSTAVEVSSTSSDGVRDSQVGSGWMGKAINLYSRKALSCQHCQFFIWIGSWKGTPPSPTQYFGDPVFWRHQMGLGGVRFHGPNQRENLPANTMFLFFIVSECLFQCKPLPVHRSRRRLSATGC